MRVSSKGRYALAAVIQIARDGSNGDSISLNDIAGALGISKLYLEQVFTQLKKRNIIVSVKGAKGGYKFTVPPSRLTAWEVIESVESTIAESAEATVAGKAPDIEMALVSKVFSPLDAAIKTMLESVSVQDLLDAANGQLIDQSYMLNM
ncbi:MAG: Rrf2 family transcriptional regulator [Oscillospiraceae bacterium]|jgi:Rrf2 family protein|nr:Rrf2 family transcriptional regulator [Oscillospiraceae bacterium]